MYNLQSSTGETAQVGIGKGEAQVFDNNDFMAREGRLASFQQADKMAKQKRAADNQDDLLKSVASVGSANIKPADLPVFQKKIEELNKEALNAFDVNGNISTTSHLKIMQMANQLKLEAEMSKNQREALEGTMKMYNKDSYYEDEYNRARDLYQNVSGNWGELPALKEKFDVTQYFRQSVNPLYENQLKAGGYGTTYGGQKKKMPDGSEVYIPKREEVVREQLTGNTDFQRRAIFDYKAENAGKMPNDAELIDFAQRKYSNLLTAYHTNPYPASASGGSGFGVTKVKTPFNVTYDENTGEWQSTTGQTSEASLVSPVTIGGQALNILKPNVKTDTKTGEILGGTYIVIPTEDQKELTKINREANEKDKDEVDKFIKRYDLRPENKGALASMDSDSDDYRAKLEDYARKKKKAIDEFKKQYPANRKEYKREVIETKDPELIQDLYFQTWGVPFTDIQAGKQIQGVNVQPIKRGVKNDDEQKPLLRVSTFNQKKGTKFTLAELKKQYPNYNVVE